MKKYAIAITSFRRSHCLYVALESLKRSVGICNWDIIVYLDHGASDYSICEGVIPVEFVRRPIHFGNKWNVPTSMIDTFRMGYEKVVYMDEDNLLCSTALEYLLASTSKAEFISTWHKPGAGETCEFQSMHANLINRRRDCESLYSFLQARKYVGRTNVLSGGPIPENINSWDIPAFCWFRNEEHKTKWADKHYCLNFGVSGVHFSNSELEASMFSGPPEQWMERVLEYSKRIKSSAFTPSDFVYE